MRKIFAFVLALTFGAGTMMAALPQGALKGTFTINASGDVIVFSQGNLQYKAAPTATWQFAATQWETLSKETNAQIDPAYEGWIDLYGWNTANNPTQTSTDKSAYADDFVDWGIHPISNGGNTANAWRTLKYDEWSYIFNSRTNAADKFGQATVNGVYGVVLLPDVWTLPEGLTFTASPNNWTTNVYDAEAWGKMEANGAVFFPKNLYRFGKSAQEYEWGCYWLGSKAPSQYLSWNFIFKETKIVMADQDGRQYGKYVRLAKDMKIPAVGDTIRYEYKGNNLYYKILWKNSTRREVGLVNDGTPSTYWTEANEPEGALVIPDSIEDWQGTKYAVTDIYEYAFGGCAKITSLDLSENKDIKAVGRYSFGECTALANVTLSDNIKSIYDYAFYKTALTSFDFKNVEELGSWAFLSGTNIETVNINKALKQIPDQTGLFDHAKVITCDAENAKFTAVDNVLYNKDMTQLISLPLGLTTEIHIPTTVTTALYRAMRSYAGPIYINSEIKFGWGPDERNSPVGDVVVGCGLYEYYTTGDFDKTNPKSNFYYVANLTAELLYEVTLKQTAGGTIAKADGTECAEVVLTATPDAGFVFTKWSDESTENPHTISVTADVEVSAVFTKETSIDAILGAPAKDGKFLRDGQLFIQHGNELFNAQGAKVK